MSLKTFQEEYTLMAEFLKEGHTPLATQAGMEFERAVAALKKSEDSISKTVTENLDHHKLADERIALRFLGGSGADSSSKMSKDVLQSAGIRNAVEAVQKLPEQAKQLLGKEEWLPAMHAFQFAQQARDLRGRYVQAQTECDSLLVEIRRLEKTLDGFASTLWGKIFPVNPDKTKELSDTIDSKKKHAAELNQQQLSILIKLQQHAERYRIVTEFREAIVDFKHHDACIFDQFKGLLNSLDQATTDLTLASKDASPQATPNHTEIPKAAPTSPSPNTTPQASTHKCARCGSDGSSSPLGLVPATLEGPGGSRKQVMLCYDCFGKSMSGASYVRFE